MWITRLTKIPNINQLIQRATPNFQFTQGKVTADQIQYELTKLYQYIEADIGNIVSQLNAANLSGPSSQTLAGFATLTDLNALRSMIQPAGSGSYDPLGAASAAEAAAIAASIAASYPGLGKIPLSSADNKVNWNKRFFVEDYANVQAAFTDACAADGILILPPGVTTNTTLTWPTNFAGSVKIQGCGERVSTLDGSIELVSNASPSVVVEGFTLTGGLAIDLTGSGYAGGQQAGSVKNLLVTGTITYSSDVHAIYLNNFGQGIVDNINIAGPGNTTGNGLTIITCSNLQGTNLTIYTCGKGFNISGSGDGEQFTNIRAVNCFNGIIGNYGPNQGSFFTNWMVDNGNIAIPGNVPVSMTGGYACIFTGGQILQATATGVNYGIQFIGSIACKVIGCDFTFCRAADSCIFFSVSSTNNSVSGCGGFGSQALVHVDATSTYNGALGNTLGTTTFLNSGGATNQLLS